MIKVKLDIECPGETERLSWISYIEQNYEHPDYSEEG